MSNIPGIRFEIPCNIEDPKSEITVKDLVDFLSQLDQEKPIYWDSQDGEPLIFVAPTLGFSLFIAQKQSGLDPK